MRAVIRAYVADHPILALIFIVVRWSLWAMAGHPMAVGTFGLAVLLGRSPASALLLAVLFDGGAIVAGSIWSDSPARTAWIWAQAARFRRRWPAAFTEAYVQPEFDRAAVFPGNYYSAPDGLRPVLVAPRLSLLPRKLSHHDVRWAVRPWSAQSFGDIAAQSGRVANADDRVVSVDLVRRKKHQRRRWDLVVSFAEPAVDPDDGSAVAGNGRRPAINGGDSNGGPTPSGRRPKSSNGINSTEVFGAMGAPAEAENRRKWRVVHDVGNRKEFRN